MNSWDIRYLSLDSIKFSTKKNLRRLKKTQFFILTEANDLILDLFSGRCDTSYGLQQSRPRVISGDLSFKLLTINAGVKNKVQLNTLHLPFKNSQFDAVTIQGGLHHLASFDQMVSCFNEIKRILKTNGYVFISEPANSITLTVWLYMIKNTRFWKLFKYSRHWHDLYEEEAQTHSYYLTTIKRLIDYFMQNWILLHHRVGLVTEFFTLKKLPTE